MTLDGYSEKDKNVGNQHFSVFNNVFYPHRYKDKSLSFEPSFMNHLQMFAILMSLRIYHLCKSYATVILVLTLPLVLKCLQYKSLENTVGKREIDLSSLNFADNKCYTRH